MLASIKAFLSGKKSYLLLAVPTLLVIIQYFTQIDLGIDGLPVYQEPQELIKWVWASGLGMSVRAAIAKSNRGVLTFSPAISVAGLLFFVGVT